ncbi:gliding motility protein MglA [Enhygromyxa salina]|uniref:Gliding motility protein MglA n=1 Tax=Enhygromyxa salina TaxID=215803 RepID=A0A0C2CUC1_9BACT|nr:GTPase domain-containing protein [Enhygromyxa salina]KIG14736.1 gliding motility protein MglA [Enhygromyxa salina]
MAQFDPERKRIVIRVVYDGPGHAGKTTNLRRLSKSFASWRRSDLVSPNTLGERTQYFDWLEVDGGLLRSYPIRAQLLTVPGQVELTLRRQFVIEGADVVVFVADSQPESVAEGRSFYAQLCEQLAAFPYGVPIVLQANKQDLPGALRPAKLAALISEGLRAPDQVKGSVASSDRGVKQTLMVALRLASESVRGRWGREDPKTQVGELGDADTTLAALEYSEAQRASGRQTPPPTLPSPDLPAAQLWPAVSGRSLLARLHGRPLRPLTSAAHPERVTLEVDDWRLTTSSERLFPDLATATRALDQLCSRKLALGSWLPEPCAVAVVADPEGQGAWLWTIDQVLPSLATQLEHADPEQRRDALDRFAEIALGAVALAERHGLVVDLDPDSFAVQTSVAEPGSAEPSGASRAGRRWTRYVGHALEPGGSIDIAGPVLELARRFATDEIALADYTEILCLGLYHLPADPELRAALRRSFADLALDQAQDIGPRRVRDAALTLLGRPAIGYAPGLR